MNLSTLDTFARAYLATALWASTDEDEEPLDENYGPEDIAPTTLERMLRDCDRFQAQNANDIGEREDDAGHDFWLTRNHHGAGFWDGDWEASAGERLTDSAHGFGEFTLYVGDDGMIHGV